jgi:hypothetical protein
LGGGNIVEFREDEKAERAESDAEERKNIVVIQAPTDCWRRYLDRTKRGHGSHQEIFFGLQSQLEPIRDRETHPALIVSGRLWETHRDSGQI